MRALALRDHPVVTWLMTRIAIQLPLFFSVVDDGTDLGAEFFLHAPYDGIFGCARVPRTDWRRRGCAVAVRCSPCDLYPDGAAQGCGGSLIHNFSRVGL